MTASQGPLSGLVIIDLTRVLAGPYCTMLLADLGARVIKIETPNVGDDARHIGPFVETASGERISAYFASLNRGKESIALDLKAPPDCEIFEALLTRADVLVENFRAGVMERLGYGWETLEARYPRLIYAAVSGFGHSGPYAERPAYDMVVQAMGGIMSVTGQPDGPPTRVGTSIGDITGGLFTAAGINAALFERARTSRGRKIDVAMLDGQLAILENAISRFEATGISPGPLGVRHPSITPFAAFKAADGYLVIAAGNDRLFKQLCDVLDRPEFATDARFASNDLRTENADLLACEIETTLQSRPVRDWLERFYAAGIPCGPINDIEAALSEPQVAARNMLVESALPGGGYLRMAGNPIKLSDGADPQTRPSAPLLDGDRQSILGELGLNADSPRDRKG